MELSTTYLGIELKNPIVISASPLSRTIHSMRSLEDNGAAAIVLYSLFEEQLKNEMNQLYFHLSQNVDSNAEAQSYFPKWDDYYVGPEQYLEHIEQSKKTLQIPIIASLNCSSQGSWIKYARQIQSAGADALELNIYYIPTDIDESGLEVEERYIDILKSIRKEVSIPIAVKISPYFSAQGNIIRKIADAGANGVVLFNRFYQPDIDLENLVVEPTVQLSNSFSTRTPLRWIAILYKKIQIDFAASTGVHTSEDILKLISAGANVTMMCSSILKNGTKHISQVLNDLTNWLITHDYKSLNEIRGTMSHINVSDSSSFERANYMKALQSYM